MRTVPWDFVKEAIRDFGSRYTANVQCSAIIDFVEDQYELRRKAKVLEKVGNKIVEVKE